MRVFSRLFNNLVNCSGIILKPSKNHFIQNTRHLSITFQYFNKKAQQGWGSKKSHRSIKIQQILLQEMADPKTEEILAPLRAKVKEQVSRICYRLQSSI